MVVDGVVALGVQPIRRLGEEGVRDNGEDVVGLRTGVRYLLQSKLDLGSAKPDGGVDGGERRQFEVVDGR